MGRNADALSEKQIATLKWIRDGCPAVDEATEVTRKISAASLKSRGLVTVKGAGAKWKASITPAGRAWLEAHPTTVTEAVGAPDGLIASVLAANGHLAIGSDAKTKTRPRGAGAPQSPCRQPSAGLWATPLLLDEREDPAGTAAWLGRRGLADRWAGGVPGEDAEDTLWADHLEEARRILADPSELGRVPDDLSAVLASVAIGSPANSALRAFARVAPGQRGLSEEASRDGAARVAWGLRSLFNVPEVMGLVRGQGSDEVPYWTKVIEYCLDGGLGAVLAEYVHVLQEALGHLNRDPGKVVAPIATAMFEALSIRAANYTADDIRVEGGDLKLEPWRLRARYALRFGAQSMEDQAELQRAGTVRTAFNSPFWPFVLATTSVGQKGLDFHQYCHAVVHWNLPANPVDLEQREGRVHRYKGHAIRKNVARAHRADGYRRAANDPWEAMFVAARKARPKGVNDLVPFWVYQVEGGARIERYVPAFPLSREVEKLRLLKRSLAAYRLVFGQYRQEDLAQFVVQAREDGQLAETMDLLMLDLSPR